MSAAETRRRKALVTRARLLLPELPTATLYRITGLLERVLAEAEVRPEAYDDLQRALDEARPRRRR